MGSAGAPLRIRLLWRRSEMRACCPANVELVEPDTHINDPAFSDAVLARFDDWVSKGIVKV